MKVASVVFVPLLVWLPLFVLSAVDGRLLPGGAGTPFLLDLSAHIRLLVALPLFLFAGLVAEARMIPTLRQFLVRQLVPDESLDKYRSAIESAFRLGDSILADIMIIALIYALDSLVIWHSDLAGGADAWYARLAAQRSVPTLAGLCYAYASLPVFQFILFRWYYRLLIWGRFLRQVARLALRLVPTHPDRLGGLGFLLAGAQAFTVFAMAHGALLAAWLSTRVLIRGTPLASFKLEIIAVPVFVVCLCIAPLLSFTRSLVRAKRIGVQEYGALAARYAREFDDKWVRADARNEPLVGSADIQSLADMAGSYDIIQSMRSLAITPQMIVAFAVVTLLPVAPFALTLMPLSEILKKLAGILF